MNYDPITNDEGTEQLPNPERGCGYLKHSKAYIRADVGPGGTLPTFVTFERPIPYKEGTLRSYQEFPGIQFELSIESDYPTNPRDEIDRHLSRIRDSMEGKDHYGTMVTAYANDLLMWVGGSYYENPEEFIAECRRYGLNKAIPVSKKQGPPPIHPGKTRVFLVHPNAFRIYAADGKNPFEEDTTLAWNEEQPDYIPDESDFTDDGDLRADKPEHAPPVETTPGIIGYSYLTRVVWTEPRDGDIPKWAKEYAETGKLDIVDVGEQVPEHDLRDADVPVPTDTEDDRADPVTADDVFGAIDGALGHADASSDEDDGEDVADEESTVTDAGAADDDAILPGDNTGPPLTEDDLPDDYNDLKAMAADRDLDVGQHPLADELKAALRGS